MLTSRFLMFLPYARGERESGISRVAEFCRANGLCTVEGAPYVLGWSGEPGAGVPERGFLARAFPGSVRSALAASFNDQPPREDAREDWCARKLRLYNLIAFSPDALRLTSDVLGRMRVYWAEVPGGIAAGSSFRDLLRCFPERLRPVDPVGLAEFLVGGDPRQNRTLHRDIHGSQGGEALEWRAGAGPEWRPDRALNVPEVEATLTVDAAGDRVLTALKRSLTESVSGNGRVILPLTGGFDSRLLACLCRDAGVEVEAVTLGMERHREVAVARAVAQTLGIRHRVIKPDHRLEQLIGIWLETTEGQAGPGTAFITGLLGLGYAPGSTVLSGFLGDVLARGAMHWWGSREPTADLSVAGEALTDYFFRRVHPQVTSLLGLPCDRAAVVAALSGGLRSTPASHQTMLLYNLEHPRNMMQQIFFLGREYHPGLPYYDAGLMRTWFSVPPTLYREKAVLRAIFRKHWPRVASIPHAEEPPSRLPRSWPAARYLVPWTGQFLWNTLQRRLLPASMQRPDHTDIWHYWSGTSRSEYARREAFTRGHLGTVGEVLGWELPVAGENRKWEQAALDEGKRISFHRAFYLLTEYCLWLKDALPVGEPPADQLSVRL